MFEKVELQTSFYATPTDEQYLPFMVDKAIKELRRHMRSKNMKPYSEPREEVAEYLSASTGRWEHLPPWSIDESDVVMYRYSITQWAVEND